MPHRPHRLPQALCVAIALASPAAALAQEDRIPPLGEPLEIEDAVVTERGEMEVQGTAVHERLRSDPRGRDQWPAQLQVQAGLARRLEGRISVEDIFGNSREAREGGAIRLGLFYQFNELRPGPVPAFGALARLGLPYGPGGRSTETLLTGAASWRTGGSTPLYLHLNLGWFAHPAPSPEERPHRYRFAIALTQALSADTVLLAIYRRDQQEYGERDLNLLLAGLRHRITPDTTIGLVGGVGIGADSPSWRIAFGVEHRFRLGGDQ